MAFYMMNKPLPRSQHKIEKPKPSVAARRGGAISVPEPMDVLSGRGGAVNSHEGNKRYRELVNLMKAEYLSDTARKNQKTQIAANIVWTIRNSKLPGQFLKQDFETNMWYEIGDKAAFRKTGQALRGKFCRVPSIEGGESSFFKYDRISYQSSLLSVTADVHESAAFQSEMSQRPAKAAAPT